MNRTSFILAFATPAFLLSGGNVFAAEDMRGNHLSSERACLEPSVTRQHAV